MNKRIKVREYWGLGFKSLKKRVGKYGPADAGDKESARKEIKRWKNEFPASAHDAVLVHVTVYKEDKSRTLKELREMKGVSVEELGIRALLLPRDIIRMEDPDEGEDVHINDLMSYLCGLEMTLEITVVLNGKRYLLTHGTDAVDANESQG